MDSNNLSILDPQILERYFQNIIFPISQDDLMQIVRSNNAPQEVIEQMEMNLQSDNYSSLDQIANELGGFYNDGEVASMDGEDLSNEG